MTQSSNLPPARAACVAMNRLIVACKEDEMALDAAANSVADPLSRERLREQARRRAEFIRDLGTGILALGGVPATRASFSARCVAAWRRARSFLVRTYDRDAYASCARVEQKTMAVYISALLQALPDDARFGIKRQGVAIEADYMELDRLRIFHS